MRSKGATILVVDDEEGIRRSLKGILEDEGHEVLCAADGDEALRWLEDEGPEMVLLDIWMPGQDGLSVLRQIKERWPSIPVVMISGHGSIELAVRAIKMGAYDFIEKPLSLDKIVVTVQNALSYARLEEENLRLRKQVQPQEEITGNSPAIRRLKEQIRIIAPTSSWVLIYGENGTGKEVVARSIYRQSKRAHAPFVEVNCAAIPEELIESELFGHEKGAFTGATQMRRGKFDLADGGTLFLDEIGDMSLATQAKILRILQEQKFQRVGGNRTIQVDVPPLRDRKEDIPLLVQEFVEEFSQRHGHPKRRFSSEVLDAFQRYHWPGNVRELKNMVERLLILSRSECVSIEDLTPPLRPASRTEARARPKTLKEAREEFERDFIRRQLLAFRGNVTKTAEAIGLERSHLHKKMKELGIRVDRRGY
jgi:two-component system nitrogen regulation response regulator NtrX